MLRIDKKVAESILRQQAALSENDPGDEGWVDRVEELSRLCEEGGARTHVAFLGTALLAKSVDRRADLKWIKPKLAQEGEAPFAFSARTLSERVLVPVSADLGIHIGMTSPQPLNNQPYFRMSYLGDGTPISAAGRPAFDYMLGLIDELGNLDENASRNALRAFVGVRRRYQPRYTEREGELVLTPRVLSETIATFVGRRSENGKRAQACVAALFDVAFGPENVDSGRINDPSRDKPGDVSVMDGDRAFKAIEVKDKPVSFNDVQIFGKKVVDMGLVDAAYVMVAQRQEVLDLPALERWADGFGLSLRLFYDWDELVEEALYWSRLPAREAAKVAVERIRIRLINVEVEPASLEEWYDDLAEHSAPEEAPAAGPRF
ncbi:SacI restriction endonuclease [Fulvimarina manganoxydans]|uniref:SacI restriction endonuclease n=1 Tax=Fulvimarina manganoxydans TaxID=937218 RepID=A0A1W1Y991_9HYPH|nr:restriction endonuclease, SacI family [Fulvimarina manganoxydans]SMC32709.1 SacI restriction endonuclease [Fulvimarina manganoxydans]